MACSHASVLTGGNSERKLDAGMISMSLGSFDDFKQGAEGVISARLGVDEEDGGSARAGTRRGVDEPEAAGMHGIEGALCVLDAKGDVGEAGASAILVEDFLYGRFGAERLEQLDHVGAVADLEKRFAHL